MHDDFEACYRAVQSRDPRFDGRFVTGVTSTGIYCRPVCPAQTPQRANVRFYRNAQAAEAAGFRACRRCRPSGTGAPVPALAGDLATRALRLIGAGVADGSDGISAVARRLGVSDRHLHRVLVEGVGAGPLALARMRRLLTARALIVETAMPITDVALAAGYQSLRQFNSEVRSGTGSSPTELRRRGPVRLAGEGAVVLRLAVRPPFDGAALLGFLGRRAVLGVERVEAASLQRSVMLAHGAAVVELTPGRDAVTARLWLDDIRDLGAVVGRCRHLLDADADPVAIGAALSADPQLAPLVATRPGLRVPGTLDGHETALRAVLGQQVTVQRATALATALADRLGASLQQPHSGVDRLFPSAAAVARGDLDGLGLTAERAATLRRVAAALERGDVDLGAGADPLAARAALLGIRGVGASTAEYIVMRALRDPDALPVGDAGLRRGFAAAGGDVARLGSHSERWRPWRAYATVHLWNSLSAPLEMPA